MKTPWPFILAFAFTCYANGAAFIESFVNYPSWHLIGAKEFLGYHHFISPRIVAFLVVPGLVGFVLTIAMLKWRPAVVPLWAVWVAIILQLVVWVATALIQIPIQIQFSSAGFSEDRSALLMVSNFWLRRIPYALTAALFLWMMHRAISSVGQPNRR
ncbi:MAG: hypothetical protein ABIV50_05160 [Opitutus sp.]